MAGLNEKQILFAHEYIKDLNATQAAIRAKYSEKTAYSIGQRLLKNVEVLALIHELMSKRTERVKVDADYVLTRLVDIDQMDVIDILTDDMAIKPITEWPKIWRQFLSSFDIQEIISGKGNDKVIVGVLKKIKWPDKVKNLELLGKHIGVGAFKDKVEHKHSFLGTDGKPKDFKIVVNYVSPGASSNDD